jgi:hypothetical protein
MALLVASLGSKLGYGVTTSTEGDVFWQDSSGTSYLYRCTATAILGPHLLVPPPAATRRCLVIPGGRAALVALKLRRDPRLSALAHEQNWTFIKYRHIRWMAEHVHESDAIEVFLGLDPIAEQPSVQLALPL